MSSEKYPYVEQDSNEPSGGNELPTYDDLANQNGPKSRFGRWRGWIEKRAAERYADITPEERERRRARGWGNDDDPQPASQSSAVSNEVAVEHALNVQTKNLTLLDSPPPSEEDVSSISLPFLSEAIEPTNLNINHFGSRFLPHTTCQIRCVLPLLGNRLLLVGHDEGLSVLDMFPQDYTENGELVLNGPGEAHCWPIWIGETVYQMSLLEVEDTGSGTPQGVVLAIIGPSLDLGPAAKDTEVPKTARMYNLSSLINLARWTIGQKGTKPLDLHNLTNLQVPNSPSKKHKHQGSLARSLKTFAHTSHVQLAEPTYSYPSFPTSSSSLGHNVRRSDTLSDLGGPPLPIRRDSDESGWDVIDDTTLRWATDFVPLAPAGSRLAGAPVLCFTIWSDETRKGKGSGGQLLAVASKSSIVLYETPRGERAYRFVKEFYTPLQPRNLAFIHQSSHDVYGSPSEIILSGRYGHRRSNSSNSALKVVVNNASSSTSQLRYGTHLSLFVVFDKKAGIIRLADSSVEEVDLSDDFPSSISSSTSNLQPNSSLVGSTASLRQRARLSSEIRESAAKWIAPVQCELPIAGFPLEHGITEPVYILTKGRRTHVLPSPLPVKSSCYTPLYAVSWKSHPKHVSARVFVPESDVQADSAILQLISFSDNGIEVHETPLGFMKKGKGRGKPEDVVHAEEDLGETGFLTCGGNWDRLDQIFGSNRGPSTFGAASSTNSFDSVDSSEILAMLKREEGIYGWYQKDLADWRIFWLGGH